MNKREYPSISNIVFTPKWYHYPIAWAKSKFLKAKYTRQRKHRGYCDLDAWNLCDYLTSVMKNSIKQLAETHYGMPMHFLEAANGDADLAYLNYTNYLETIVEDLEIVEKEVETAEEVEVRKQALKRALALIEPIYFDLWD